MMLWAAIILGTVLACEVALRLPLGRVLTRLSSTPRKVARIMGSAAISDHWKEKVVPAYAGRIMVASLTLFACLLAIAAPVAGLAALATGSLGAGAAVLMRPLVLVIMIGVGSGYIALRRRLAG